MKRALVLSAETPSACATVRGLHAAGFDVTVLAEDILSPAAASRTVARSLRVGAWLSGDLAAHVEAAAPDVIVPVTEGDLARLAPVRGEVERWAPIVAPSPEVLDRATDKVAATNAAASLEIPIPEQVVIPRGADPGESGPGDFPVVLKPSRSRVLGPGGEVWGATAVWAADEGGLRATHARFSAAGVDTIVQRPLSGVPVLASVLVRSDGEPSLWFVHRRVRQARPEGGPSACAISHPPEPKFVQPAVELAIELGIDDVPVQFEFVVPDAGDPVLLDVNPRPWGTLGLALDAGVNFYGHAARRAVGDALPTPPPPYREGLIRHYLPFELRHAWAVVFDDPPDAFPGDWPDDKLEAALGWGFLPGEGLVGRPDDPLPALVDALRLVRRLFRR